MKKPVSHDLFDRREFLETAGVFTLGLSAAALLTPKAAVARCETIPGPVSSCTDAVYPGQ